MDLKITIKKSKNFETKKFRKIKYVIIHYTGMKNQFLAIKRLQSRVAKVSCHYLISKKGKIYQLVKDKDIAWHAGKSKWNNDVNLNSKSIGIELVNTGKEAFPADQIKALNLKNKILRSDSEIKKKTNKYKYIEGNELKILKEKIITTLSLVDKLTGWEMTFLTSIVERIDYTKDDKLFLTQKQINPLIEILGYRIDYLSLEDHCFEIC